MRRPRYTRPQLSEECVYNISKAASEVLVRSLIGGNDLNYVAHKGCVRRASADGRKHQEFLEKAALTRWKDLADRVVLKRLWREMENGAWLKAKPHCLNGTELQWEKFQDNLLL